MTGTTLDLSPRTQHSGTSRNSRRHQGARWGSRVACKRRRRRHRRQVRRVVGHRRLSRIRCTRASEVQDSPAPPTHIGCQQSTVGSWCGRGRWQSARVGAWRMCMGLSSPAPQVRLDAPDMPCTLRACIPHSCLGPCTSHRPPCTAYGHTRCMRRRRRTRSRMPRHSCVRI